MLPPGRLTGLFVGGASGCFIQRESPRRVLGHNYAGRLGDGSIVHLDAPAAVPGL